MRRVLFILTLILVSYNAKAQFSIELRGGVAGAHGFKDTLAVSKKLQMSPEVTFGLKYKFNPFWRLGLNMGYANFSLVHTQTSKYTEVIPNYKVGSYSYLVNKNTVRSINLNKQHYLMTDLQVGYNLFELWRDKIQDEWSLWIEAGLGYAHVWDKATYSDIVSMDGIAKGDNYYNAYNHDYISTSTCKSGLNALYIPFTVSAEYNLTHNITWGAYAQYKLFATRKDMLPSGICSAGMTLRYTFGQKKKEIKPVVVEKIVEKVKVVEKRVEVEKPVYINKPIEVKTDSGLLYVDHIVAFAFDSDEISVEESVKLLDLLKRVRQTPGVKIELIGEASVEGAADYNQRLSERRLDKVKKYFEAVGFNENNLTSSAIGALRGGDSTFRRVMIKINPSEK